MRFSSLVFASLSASLCSCFVIRVQEDARSEPSLLVGKQDGGQATTLAHAEDDKEISDLENSDSTSFTTVSPEIKYLGAEESVDCEEDEEVENEVELDDEVVDEDEEMAAFEDEETAPVKPNILQIIYNSPELSSLAALIKERPALEEALASSQNELTLFAPINDAFKSHRPHPSVDAVTQVLLYHIVEEIYPSEALADGDLLDSALELESLNNHAQKLKVSVTEQDTDGHSIKINGHVHVTQADLRAVNGIVHFVDHVLIPPPNAVWMLVHSFREYAAFSLALKRVSLDNVVKFQREGMLFAPTNTAFKKIPVSKLAYLFSPAGSSQLTLLLLGHISPFLLYGQEIKTHPQPLVVPTLGAPLSLTISGNEIIVNGGDASVVFTDLCAANGVIHGIDSVIGVEGVGNGEATSSEMDLESSRDEDRYVEEDWYKAIFENKRPSTTASSRFNKMKKAGKHNKKVALQ